MVAKSWSLNEIFASSRFMYRKKYFFPTRILFVYILYIKCVCICGQ